MDESSISERDLDVLRDILRLASPDRRVPDEDGSALLARLGQLFGCLPTVRTVDPAQPPSEPTGEPPSRCQELTVEDGLDEAGRRVELVLRREDGRPFGHREQVLLDLLTPHLAAWLATASRGSDPEATRMLTGRQLEILHLVQLGMSNKEIARGLGISEATVRKHLENAFQRLGVPSRTAAVATALSVTVTG